MLLPRQARGFGRNIGARRGRVQAVEVQIGRVVAEVQDRDRGACPVSVEVTPFPDGKWNAVLDALAGEAIYAAQLLAGDMPAAIESVFADAGVHLLPQNDGQTGAGIATDCAVCERWEQPCKHISAVLYVIGQMLAEDPWLLFRLRGRDRQQVLQGLRQRRQDTPGGPGAAALPPTGPEEQPGPRAVLGSLQGQGDQMPLTAQMDTFWGRAKALRDLHYHINPPSIRLALLRRLGRPPFPEQSLETYDELSAVYQRVTEEALDLAFAPEPDEDAE